MIIDILAVNPDFYLIHGCETGYYKQLFTGNIPFLTDTRIIRSILIGLLLLVASELSLRAIKRKAANKKVFLGKHAVFRVFCEFFIAWELLLHLPYFSSTHQFVPDPIAFWKANPMLINSTKKKSIGLVGVDREPITGIFDTEYYAAKPDNTFRIIFMGDSQAISYRNQSYAPNICYPKFTQKLIRKKEIKGPEGQEIQIIDAAISGYSSWQGLLLLKSDILSLKPDVIVEAFGYHDHNSAFSPDKDVLTDSKLIHNIRKFAYMSRVFLMIRSISLRSQARAVDMEDGEKQPQCPRVSPQQFEENLKQFVSIGKDNSFRVFCFNEPVKYPNDNLSMKPYYEVTEKLGKELNIPVIETNKLFWSMPNSKMDNLFTDQVHFSPEGHSTVAEFVLKRLQEEKILSTVSE